jgi:hypothetical protein
MSDLLAGALPGIVGYPDETEELRAPAAIALGAVLEGCDITEFDDPLGFDDLPIAELAFYRIRTALQKLYEDPGVPKLVRRKIPGGVVALASGLAPGCDSRGLFERRQGLGADGRIRDAMGAGFLTTR